MPGEHRAQDKLQGVPESDRYPDNHPGDPELISYTDPASSLQADSPYYQVEDDRDFQQTHSVIKKHHKEVEKDGGKAENISNNSVTIPGFSMYLHEDGCICPKPQFGKHKQIKTEKQENNQEGEGGKSTSTDFFNYFYYFRCDNEHTWRLYPVCD